MTISWFKQEEENAQGRLHFIPCPHFAEKGEPYGNMRLIQLRDEPATGADVLVLCEQCAAVVIGRSVDEIIQKAVHEAFNGPIVIKPLDNFSPMTLQGGAHIGMPDSADDEDFGHPI